MNAQSDAIKRIQAQEAIGLKLVHAVTEYDRKQESKRGYNPHALPIYLSAVQSVIDAMDAGKTVRQAILANFSDRLLDACLKAVGEAKATDAELGRI